MLAAEPVTLPQMVKLLVLKFNSNLHPLRKMALISGHISGKRKARMSNTQSTYANGTIFMELLLSAEAD